MSVFIEVILAVILGVIGVSIVAVLLAYTVKIVDKIRPPNGRRH